MSTFGETLASHTRRLIDDDRNRQREGHGDNHNETTNETDPNHSLNCAGGAPKEINGPMVTVNDR